MSAADLVDEVRWAEPGGREAAASILGFLEEIGVRVEAGRTGEPAFLPGLAFRDGTLLVEPDAEVWPGDLLHEAGHLAVTAPDARAGLSQPAADPGEEMAALAWSAAAAFQCGLPLGIVFHEHGYKGNGPALAAQFATGNGPGVPMLAWYGMTAEPHNAASRPAFPAMQRWLR